MHELATIVNLQAHPLRIGSDELLQMALGLMPHDQLMRGIELYGTKVKPMVEQMLAHSPVDAIAK